MTIFSREFGNGRLYAAPAGPGQLVLVLPAAQAVESIALDQAWTSAELRGTLVYAAAGAGYDERSAEQFVSAVLQRVSESGQARGVIWLADPTAWRTRPLDGQSAPMLGMDEAGTRVRGGLSAPIAAGVRLTIADAAELSLQDESVSVRGAVSFDGPHAPAAAPPATSALLALGGSSLGTLAFAIFLTRQSLRDAACWGFQFAHPAGGDGHPPVAEWLPLAAGGTADALGFDAVIDPSNPVNAATGPGGRQVRSVLAFTGRDADGAATSLESYYRTSLGGVVWLAPVTAAGEPQRGALVFQAAAPLSGTERQGQLAPAGDFVLSVDGTPDEVSLLCGLHGTELIAVRPQSPGRPGDRIRFTPYQPAYAPRYPFALVSPVGPPVDVEAPLLDSAETTSWAQIVPGDGRGAVGYIAQPRGAALYGRDNPIWNRGTGLMGWRQPSATLPPGVAFPLVPYSGLAPRGYPAADFEREVVAATRRKLIGATAGMPGTAAPYDVGTAPGWAITIGDGRWTKVLFGRTLDPPFALGFVNPSAALQQAFQTGQVFCVAANAAPLGTARPGDGSQPTDQPLFLNTVRIGGWTLAANVGTSNRYDDYRNIMIVKGRKGRLYDPGNPSSSLVSNPERWTQKEQFAVPSGDQGELVILSRWLQDYFARAFRVGGEELARFNQIAADENWTGVLVLRADIVRVPDDLAGIVAGVADQGRFNAHHIGFDATPLTVGPSGPRQDDASSMFGLIDYTDPLFTPPRPGERPQPVAPAPGTVYDFRLLSLRVLFAASTVRIFHSYAQLTIASWFDLPVSGMREGGNPYAAIVLGGSLQMNNARPVYSLTSTAEATFCLDGSVLEKVEISQASMTTRSVEPEDGDEPDDLVSSWFGLSGFLSFKALQGTEPDGQGGTGRGAPFGFDIFSFGGTDSRQGLAFSNLGILLSFRPDDPAGRTLSLTADGIRFDISASTSRPGSLFRQFALEVRGLVSGTADAPPAKSGYATVVTDAQLSGVDGGPWWGIEYQLALGTPGNLAGRAGLTARLLTAWAPGDRAVAGLALPGTGGGAKLISLQTVLKLSLGQIWLRYDTSEDAFLLLFTEIALRLFGLLSIPPGSTLFYLYGDPQGAGSPSGLAWYAMYRKEGASA
jgi:hypothetical protein